MRRMAFAAVVFLLLLSSYLQPARPPPHDSVPTAPEMLPTSGLATGSGNQLSPDLDGPFLVWEDDQSGHPNVHLKDLRTSQEYGLGGSSTRQSRFPEIRNGLVSFVDAPTKDTGIGPGCNDRSTFCIVLFNATTGIRSQYLNLNGLAPVATTDALVALSVRRRGTYTICPDVYDIKDPAAWARPCTNEVGVFYTGNRTLMYLTKSVEGADRYDPYGRYRVNCGDFTWESYPRISGKLVVWQDNRNSAFTLDETTCTWTGNRWDVYGFDLTTWREVPLLVSPWNETHPDVDGNLLVWADDRNGNWDIYAKALDTGQEFQVTNDPGTQRNPVVSEGCIAWEDDRNADWDIYGTCLTGAPRVVKLSVDPETLNLKSRGRWVTAYIESENASVADIDARSLALEGVPTAWSRVLENTTLMAKFDRQALAATLTPEENVVTLSGRWKDGSTFTATDTIHVISPSR